MKATSIRAVRRFNIFWKEAIINAVLRFLPGLVAALVTRSRANQDDVGLVAHSLMYSRDPLFTLNYFSENSGVRKAAIWRALMHLEGKKCPSFETIIQSRSSVRSDELRLRLELRHALLSETLEASALLGLIEDYLNIAPRVSEPRVLVSTLVSVVIAKGPVEKTELLLQKIGTDCFRLTEFQQIKFLSRLEQARMKKSLSYWAHRLGPSMSEAGQVKLSLIWGSLFRDGSESYQAIENRFAELPYNIAEKYRVEIKPMYDGVPVSNNFLAARFDTGSVDALRNLLVKAVGLGQALSYIRLGDGECYGLADQVLVDEQGERRQEMHWWGQHLSNTLRKELQGRFREAVEDADVLGVPTVLRLVRDFNLVKRDEYPCNSLMSRIICVMKQAGPYFEKKILVEDQSNLYLFDNEFIKQLFASAVKVCVVSGLNSRLVEDWVPDRGKLQCIEIPTHRLLRNGDVGSSIDDILPNVYKEYLNTISFHAGPGVVFLVSAGFIGKIFIAEAASKGAVALDVGQSLVSAIRNQGVEA